MIFEEKMFDLCIRNGRVIDWKNRTDTVADLGIRNGKIEALGTHLPAAKTDFDASGRWVVPGIIDSHMHASAWLGGQMSFRMLALAGVTTALDMAGPVESVKEFLRSNGTGINIGTLEQMRVGFNLTSTDPSEEELNRVIDDALDRGAFGIKLLGGHYPLTPEASGRLLKLCARKNVYFAVHAGSTVHGSNIEGMEEIIRVAQGTPFHLCHINAYCRGSVHPLEDEIREATRLLQEHPEIDSESYLSPINGCSGKCVHGVPESGVTRNCLISHGYEATQDGLKKAIQEGFACVNCVKGGVVVLACPEEGLCAWQARQTDIPVSFPVNPALSRFYFAAKKRSNGAFLVNSFCTDGGGIPRNVIIKNGISLVRFGALSPQEFVLKSSYAAATLLGLQQKGHFSEGADADITVIDPQAQEPTASFCTGKLILLNGKLFGSGGTLIAGERGRKTAEKAGLAFLLAQTESVLRNRLQKP